MRFHPHDTQENASRFTNHQNPAEHLATTSNHLLFSSPLVQSQVAGSLRRERGEEPGAADAVVDRKRSLF
ncbi:unnamed protein product [Pleuronectes platessa]|uniref:Uncharacterized protein n=1 Tax=Pleuronectes platessa TaxID=8262 RepID=A0A9N7UKP7_PLEPL|nr:unnamed protein product [Pleuronectes platessa]